MNKRRQINNGGHICGDANFAEIQSPPRGWMENGDQTGAILGIHATDYQLYGCVNQPLFQRQGRKGGFASNLGIQGIQREPSQLCIEHLALDKGTLAKRYDTSVRTIENWIAQNLIVGVRNGRALQFDPLDCDRRLFAHTAPQTPCPNRENQNMQAINPQEKSFATTAWLAQRYDVDIRTIKNWKKMGLLPNFKIRRVLRFDVAARDASLRQYGYIT